MRDGMQIGKDTYIHDTVHISYPELVKLGDHSAIDFCTYISTALETGVWTHIAPLTSIIGGKSGILYMEDFATIAAGSRLICGSDDFVNSLMGPHIPIQFRTVKIKPIIMGAYSIVGTNSVVMPGVVFGIGAALGACSLATHDLEPWTIYVGTPARPFGRRNKDRILSCSREMGY